MNINKRIYLDYAATTPVAPEVIEEMVKHLGYSDNFGNPASRSHDFGWNAEKVIEESKKTLRVACAFTRRNSRVYFL